METPDDIEDNRDLDEMQKELQQLQKLGFQIKVVNGKNYVIGEFIKEFDFANRTTTTRYKPKD